MQVLECELVLSPSDLTGFAACEHLTQLELRAARGEIPRATRDDPLLDVLSRRGTEHEKSQLDRYKAGGQSVIEFEMPASTRAALEAAAQETLDAMRKGVDVIYQATFFDGRWRGHADFLLRVEHPEHPSALGTYSYEVADAKLSRRVKAAAILQMCAYSEQLEDLQDYKPKQIHVLTGDGEQHTLKLSDYSAYYRTLKGRYEVLVLGAPAETYPDPVDHCSICRWADVCKERRRADDHLSLVAGMRRDQTRKLTAVNITTTTDLADLAPGAEVSGIADASLDRLRHQAALQVKARGLPPYPFELLPPEPPTGEVDDDAWPKRGFAALPAPSPGDLFFDMEGDPYALDKGLEYLFGVIERTAKGEPRYQGFWAHDRDEEKLAFEAFIDFVMQRLADDPNLHIYHYAPYEPTAMKKLMGMHGTREHEVDVLLRGERFVDLYAVVRQGVRIGSESYSLKQVEKLYMQRPEGEVMDAGGSIVAYEEWLDSRDDTKLEEIRAYNEDDCSSTLQLRDWLERQRVDAEALYGEIPRPVLASGEASEELTAHEAELEALSARLTHDVPDDPERRTTEQQAGWLLAQLLQWHRREEKPEWWTYFHRIGFLNDEDFANDRECIGGLEFVGEVGTEQLSTIYRYEFEPQDHKFSIGSKPTDPATERGAGEVMWIDDAQGLIDLKRRSSGEVPHPRSLMPGTPIKSIVLQDGIGRVAEWVAEHGIDAPGPYQAARDLLLRAAPRVSGLAPGDPLAGSGERGLDPARRLVPALDASYLAIQGPPGSGKTYTGAHMIVDLVRMGRTVGITAHSHAVIGNLLEAVCERAHEEGVTVRALQKSEEHQRCSAENVECTTSNEVIAAAVESGSVDVVAGTAWLWAREQMSDSVDVLFVDEAGQKSLADVVAVSGAAKSIVLLGDPQQLAQPSKGSHPVGAEVSALEHILDGSETMPEELGLFLGTTFRMHPTVCAFISEVAYDGRLESEPTLERQAVDGHAGLRWVPVEHEGNRTSSPEEAERVRELVDDLVGTQWIDRDGNPRKLTLDDVLIVAPYNAHVARLQQNLPAGARIGTVDKFQGQEAPVTIYSMATSTADDVPRGMEFLYDLHRLNVAVSRAQAMPIIVCSPALLRVLCRNAEQMRLANGLCLYSELCLPAT
jgi:predicted RecB family nuclease